jgi:hypothetical protein
LTLGTSAAMRSSHRGVHVLERGVRPRGRYQRKRRGTLIGEVLLEFALHMQGLRTLNLEPAAGQLARTVDAEVDRGHKEKQPDREHRPAISAQVAAQAHHELLDSPLPAFSPALQA